MTSALPDISQLRFLVAEDMPSVRKMIVQEIQAMGVTHVAEAGDGDEAWNLLIKESEGEAPIQFIVSDWGMPNLKGIDLLKKCRAHPAYKNVGFLMLTAEAEAPVVMDAVVAGVDGYIVKPFVPEDLHSKILAICVRRFSPKKIGQGPSN